MNPRKHTSIHRAFLGNQNGIGRPFFFHDYTPQSVAWNGKMMDSKRNPPFPMANYSDSMLNFRGTSKFSENNKATNFLWYFYGCLLAFDAAATWYGTNQNYTLENVPLQQEPQIYKYHQRCNHGYSTNPPQSYPPPRNKALLRVY